MQLLRGIVNVDNFFVKQFGIIKLDHGKLLPKFKNVFFSIFFNFTRTTREKNNFSSPS